jgi:Mrp family chromosome partitioning ATPase
MINSELMRRLSEQQVILRAQLAEQSSTLLGQHPRIKELRAQIADLERQMRAEADRLARSLENDAKLASSKVDALTATLEQLKRQAATTNEQDVQLRALERDAKSQRDLLESYLAKYREATARDSIGAAATDARIISSATVSTTPSWPKKVPIILVAGLAMFVLACVFIMTGELLRAMPIDDGLEAMSMRQPGRLAPKGDAASGVALHALARAMASPRSTAVDDTMDRLVREISEGGGRRITVIGSIRNVGATQSALKLARGLGEQSRVILVDLALESPNLSAIATDPAAPGLAELVAGSASFGQIITRDRHSGVHVVLAGRAAIDPAAILNAQRLSIAIEALARSYDHVVIDAGAAQEVTLQRYAMLAPRAILVAGEAKTPATADARERLLKAGFADVSVIVAKPSGPETVGTGDKAAA